MRARTATADSLRIACGIACLVTGLGAAASAQSAKAGRAVNATWTTALTRATFRSAGVTLPYRLFDPKPTAGTRLPLVVFLHGAGERGANNTAQLTHGVRDFVAAAAQQDHPCFVLAPQCPRGVWWPEKGVYATTIELTKQIIATAAVDPERVYITGLSMGGYGTWHALAHDPELFAAALPICGGGTAATAKRLAAPILTNLPVWNFHGDADKAVPIEQSRTMIAGLRESGNEPRFTTYKGVGHNSWSRTYANREVRHWLFSQRRPVPPRALVDGDRVVFFGDSVTAHAIGPDGFIGQIEARLADRFPKRKIQCFGAGMPGDRVADLQARLDEDVLQHKPTVVVIAIGINDVRHPVSNQSTSDADFDAGLRDLVQRVRAANARVILCTPSLIGEKRDGTNARDKKLDSFAALGRAVARDRTTQLLDLRRHCLAHLRRHNKNNASKGILTRDGVHLNAAGDAFVAARMLEALGVPSTPR